MITYNRPASITFNTGAWFYKKQRFSCVCFASLDTKRYPLQQWEDRPWTTPLQPCQQSPSSHAQLALFRTSLVAWILSLPAFASLQRSVLKWSITQKGGKRATLKLQYVIISAHIKQTNTKEAAYSMYHRKYRSMFAASNFSCRYLEAQTLVTRWNNGKKSLFATTDLMKNGSNVDKLLDRRNMDEITLF